jgi:hypothetical protein
MLKHSIVLISGPTALIKRTKSLIQWMRLFVFLLSAVRFYMLNRVHGAAAQFKAGGPWHGTLRKL